MRGEVIGGRDLRTADRLLVALLLHDLRALQAQLHAGEGVDGVVDAQMPGNPAAQKRAVRGVDDGVALQGRDVPTPDAQARVGGGARKLVGFGDARFGDHELENAILHLQKLRRSGLRLARVHQRAELLPLLHEPARVLLRFNALTPRTPFVHQMIYQEGHILYQLHHGGSHLLVRVAVLSGGPLAARAGASPSAVWAYRFLLDRIAQGSECRVRASALRRFRCGCGLQRVIARKGAGVAAMGKTEVLQYLDDQGVSYQKVEHEPVFTMEGMEQLNLPFAAEVVKNLFLRDDKKRAYYLVVMPEDKPANLKALRATLESRPLRFASGDDLEAILGLRAGAVSPLGVLNDDEHRVQVVLDEELRGYEGLGIHPNENTATLHVPLADVLALFDAHGTPYRFVPMERPEA